MFFLISASERVCALCVQVWHGLAWFSLACVLCALLVVPEGLVGGRVLAGMAELLDAVLPCRVRCAICGVLCVLLLRAVRGVLCVVLYVRLVTRYVCVWVARTAVCCVRSFYMLYAVGCVCCTACGAMCVVCLQPALAEASTRDQGVCCVWCAVCGPSTCSVGVCVCVQP